MLSAQYFKDTARLLWQSYNFVLSGVADADDIRRWLDLGHSALRAANILGRSPDLNVADKKKLQAAIALIKSILRLLQDRPIGAGIAVEQINVRDVSGENDKSESIFKSDVVGGENDKIESDVVSSDENDVAGEKAKVQSAYPTVSWDEVETAFESRIRTGLITNHRHLDLKTFMKDAKKLFIAKIKQSLEKNTALKVNTVLGSEYSIVKNDEETMDIKYFNTKTVPIYSTTDLDEWFVSNVQQSIDADMEEFQEQESGWSLRSILNLSVNINKFNPMRGSSFIELPDFIKNKKACINVMNDDDDYCFKWAILSAIHPAAINANRVSSYSRYQNELNFKGIKFPVDPRQITKFEKQNDVSVNVYFLKKKKGTIFDILPRHLTCEKKDKHVNLLLVESHYVDENDDGKEQLDDSDIVRKCHYVWIKDLSRLVRSQVSSRKSKVYICDRCLHVFWTNEKLVDHTTDCMQVNQCKVVLPKDKDSLLKFKNFVHENRVPFVVYADFECILKPVENDKRALQHHEAFSVGYFVKCSYDDTRSYYKSYRQIEAKDEAPAEWFVKNLETLALELNEMYKNPQPMRDLTIQEKIDFTSALVCYICKKDFTDSNKKVRDHCHFTGEYRGPAHQTCNIMYQDSRMVPVVFHNLTGYDSHLLIKEIVTCFPGRVSVIPQTKERYISFTKFVEGTDVNLRFIDSFRFMAASLDKLSSYLERLDIVERVFQKDDGFSLEQIGLLKRKGVFPYDYVSSFDKLKEVELPSKADFYSGLYDAHITDEDYEHAENVWQSFNVQTLGQYSDLYLKTDVLLLAEVFENFRENCLQAYGLDPAHYYTTPGLTWDAMLKYTKVELQLLTDIDMIMFIERGIRGGISQCCNRYAKANNPYMKEGYKVDEETKYLMYYDVNNLYGWGMTQYLPHGDFEWVEDVKVPSFYNVPDNHPYGFILEVDLEYPETLHNAHKDFPFCSEHRAAPGAKQKKLMTTLHDKKRYVLHYRALKQALQHGLRLKEVYRALKFSQSLWLKPYIDLNSERRKNAKNEFEKMLFKLFNNAVYGKTMENERKRVDVKLVSKWTGRYGAEALIARPNFHSCTVFDENLVAIQLLRTDICIRKPIYIGLTVLDVSKTLVYRFHYDYMLDRLGDQCKLLYTDTDSLVYEVSNVDIYDLMRRDLQEFDTSDYPETNPFNMPRVNKKIVGLMKDECNGEVMLEFVGLRSKMYSIRVQDQKTIKKAKGVKTSVVNAKITFDDYMKCLHENGYLTRVQKNIRSRRHQLFTEVETKIALSAHDDKRCLKTDETDTLPWGHNDIVLQEMELEVHGVEPPPLLEEEGRPMTENLESILSPLAAAAAVEPPDSGVGDADAEGSSVYHEALQSPELIPSDEELPRGGHVERVIELSFATARFEQPSFRQFVATGVEPPNEREVVGRAIHQQALRPFVTAAVEPPNEREVVGRTVYQQALPRPKLIQRTIADTIDRAPKRGYILKRPRFSRPESPYKKAKIS